MYFILEVATLVVSAKVVVEFGDVKLHSVGSGKTIAEPCD